METVWQKSVRVFVHVCAELLWKRALTLPKPSISTHQYSHAALMHQHSHNAVIHLCRPPPTSPLLLHQWQRKRLIGS